jgi:hypothetical protein
MSAARVRDREGNLWQEAGVNAFQQRQLKCIEGARIGDVILDPRCGPPPPRPEYVPPPRDPWLAALTQYLISED